MSYIEVEYPKESEGFYALLHDQLGLYIGGECDFTAALANASAVIKAAFADDANWVGFYLVRNEELVLGPFQGRPAVSRIPFGGGVCGTAWAQDESQVVGDVSCFTGHIACDYNSRSGIVIPLRSNGRIFGVLDIDSVLPGRFTEDDRIGLESAVGIIESRCVENTKF